MEKFLLFTTGGGSADPLNWSNDEASLYSTSELKGMKPASSRSIDLFFETKATGMPGKPPPLPRSITFLVTCSTMVSEASMWSFKREVWLLAIRLWVLFQFIRASL